MDLIVSPPSWLGSGLKRNKNLHLHRSSDDVSPPSWLGSGLKQHHSQAAGIKPDRLPTFLAGEWIETSITLFMSFRG